MLEGLRGRLKWLDPFTYVDLYLMPMVNPKGDKLVENIVYVVSALVFAFVIYNFVLAGILGTASPLVIVYSGSMEPVLYRGDVVVLTGSKDFAVREAIVDFPVGGKPISGYAEVGVTGMGSGAKESSLEIGGVEYEFDASGPVVVYYSLLRRQDIIHRAVLKLKAPDGDFLITYGDSNTRIDQDCRGGIDCISLYPVPADGVKGQYLFHIPLIGYAKLLVFDDLPRLLGF